MAQLCGILDEVFGASFSGSRFVSRSPLASLSGSIQKEHSLSLSLQPFVAVSRRLLAAQEVWNQATDAFGAGNLVAADRLATHYDSIMEETDAEYEEQYP